ncbi:MAG: Mur ligase family protein [Patescibacteria group bacterium]
MNFSEAYNFIISLNNLSKNDYLQGKDNPKLYLKRLQCLLDIMGNPEKKIKHYIHITGTSGKGSVATFVSSILRASGKKVGLLTSPHPSIITERWEVGGQEMEKYEFVENTIFLKTALKKYLQKYVNSPWGLPSFFEIITAMGLCYFAQKKVDFAVLEVGCGGRYDSTNIIPKKDIAIITNIGLDHTDILGTSKAKIAREKSGIIKRGCRVLTMERDPKINAILAKEARAQKARLIEFNSKYTLIKTDTQGSIFKYQNQTYTLSVLGKHQIENSILAIQAAKLLKIKNSAIKKGLAQTKMPIRMEVVSRKPLIILDGAHNPDKIRAAIKTISDLKLKNINLLVGFSGNKNIKKMISQLAGLKPKIIACTRYTINPLRKVADPKDLADRFKKLLPKTDIKIFIDPKDAFLETKARLKANDMLLVTGSMFLAGELRTQN